MAQAPRVDRRSVLRSVSIFEGIGDRELEQLVRLTTTKRVKAREVLFRKGDEQRQLYGVMSGRLTVSGAGEDGKEVVFAFLDPGEVIGEVSLLDQNPQASGTVEAIEDSELFSLHRRDLIPFLERHPRVALNLAGVLAARLRRLSELMEDTLFLTLPSRLAKKLIGLAQAYGKRTPEGVRIGVKLPQAELGELVGATRESINKQMRAWGERGLIEVDRGFITILDEEGLESVSRYMID